MISRPLGVDVEFMPVGEGQKAGDAIVIRYGDAENYQVMVVDGGTEDAGEKVLEHINRYCGAGRQVSHMVCTHSDGDHASGLRTIIEKHQVLNLWLHRPWTYASQIVPLFTSSNWTPKGLEGAIRREYPLIGELEALALVTGATVKDPFEGDVIGPFTVLSPKPWVYAHLVPQFRRTPDPNVDALKTANMWLEQPSLRSTVMAAVGAKIANWLPEHWDVEMLSEYGVTSAENETSVVLYGNFSTTSVLLTADAGVNALRWANDFAAKNGIDLTQTELVQVPHHGSRRNVSPSVLDLLVGPKLPQGTPNVKTAVVSAPKDDEVHPRRLVANAFLRRGAPVYATQGRSVRWHRNMEERPHYVPVKPLPFYDTVEDET